MDRGFDTEETLTRVYEEFFPKIYNYVYYQIHNRAVTDDLVKMCIRDRTAVLQAVSGGPERRDGISR